MALNRTSSPFETSGISIAELRSRFQKEEILLPKCSSPPSTRFPRNGFSVKPSQPPTTTTRNGTAASSPKNPKKVIVCNDITNIKSKLNKVLLKEDAVVLPPENGVESGAVKETAVIPRVSIKPNRSHLSSLIVEVQQQKRSSDIEPVSRPPPPLPPWPGFSKNSRLQVKLKTLSSDVGPPPLIPFRHPSVKLRAFPYSTPPLPQRNADQTSKNHVIKNEVKIPSSPIPEYTVEQELGGAETPDELYDDADNPVTPSIISTNSSTSGVGFDDLYHDSYTRQEDMYEDVGSPTSFPYKMTEAAAERSKKKKLKEEKKKQREIQKSRERFGLNGTEVEVDLGIVKEDTRKRNKSELQARAGDRISILKISDTPVGKWLVKNSDGQVGYMDLVNIEVDPDAVRSVMRQSMTSSSIELAESLDFYVDGHSETIYEELHESVT